MVQILNIGVSAHKPSTLVDGGWPITDDGLLTGDMDLVDVNTAVVTYSIFDRNGDVYKLGINAEDLYDEIVKLMEQLKAQEAEA